MVQRLAAMLQWSWLASSCLRDALWGTAMTKFVWQESSEAPSFSAEQSCRADIKPCNDQAAETLKKNEDGKNKSGSESAAT